MYDRLSSLSHAAPAGIDFGFASIPNQTVDRLESLSYASNCFFKLSV